MSDGPTLDLPDPAATDALGRALAAVLRPGDALCLSGGLGAGKSALARAIIQARLAAEGRHEDAPSPTYTLVQTYETAAAEIWHADLYRLSDPEEARELGLLDDLDRRILLIEWAERLGHAAPARRLAANLAIAGAGRRLRLTPVGPGWDDVIAAASAALRRPTA